MATEVAAKITSLEQRREELRPLVDEYAQIEKVLGRVEAELSNGVARTVAPRAARQPAARGASRARAARTGGRRDEALGLIKNTPGLTIPEMAKSMGINDNYLYRVTAALVKDGLIKKDEDDKGFVLVEK